MSPINARITCILCLFFVGLNSWASAQPTDNPVEARYPGSYPWAAEIAWSEVVNIVDYGGDPGGVGANDAAYVAARDAAAALGGGVVYFPAGEYRFEDSIGLVDTVVLRGPESAVGDATEADFRPPARLVFPRFEFVASGSGTDPDTAFKAIGMSGDGIRTGLVNLDVNRASVFAGGYSTRSENIVIMGVRSNNVASEQPWSVPTPEQEPWQIHPNRFVANISAFAYRNVLVANCRVNDAHYWVHREQDGKDLSGAPADLGELSVDDFEQPGYLIEDGGSWRTLEAISGVPYVFEYTDHYGINVQGSTGEWGAAPWEQPNLFYSGAVIRDNWVYCTMRVKIDSSGRGLVIKDNILKDREGKRRWYDPNGVRLVGNSATLENRGIDWRGHEVRIEGNEIEVFRHLLSDGSYKSVDGEGILHQEVHGSTIEDLVIRNNTVNAYIGVYKMPYTRDVLIEGNRLIAPGYIMVDSDTNGGDFPMYDVMIRENDVDGGIFVGADLYTPGVVSAEVRNNRVDGTISVEDHVLYSGNTKRDGSTEPTIEVRSGAVAVDRPAEGILYADKDPDEAVAGETIHFSVEVETPSVDVERVEFYRHKTLMHTDVNPPYEYEYVSDGTRALWSAKVAQREQAGGFELYTVLMVKASPDNSGLPEIAVTAPAAEGEYVAPEDFVLEAAVVEGRSGVERVEFYDAGQFLGEDADGVAPYRVAWEGVGFGNYSVTAKVWDGEGRVVVSEPLAIEVEDVPNAAPAGFEAAAYSDSGIDLRWDNPAANAEYFQIERSLAGSGNWVEAGTVHFPVVEFRDTGLESETAYDYRVKAVNEHGEGEASETVTVSTLATAAVLPEPPVGMRVRALSESVLEVSWQAGSESAFGYKVEYWDETAGDWMQWKEAGASALGVRDSGLEAGTVRYYRVRAWNNLGESALVVGNGATLSEGLAESYRAGGLPWTIPGKVEFEDYNPGGYFDTSSDNEGGADYRFPDPVDISQSGENLTIGWIRDGEWLEYTVLVEEAGLYEVEIRYASPNSDGSLSFSMNGEAIGAPIVFAQTGGWGDYEMQSLSGVWIPGGHGVLRMQVENPGFNLDWMEFRLVEAANYSNWQAALLGGEEESGSMGDPDGDGYANILEMLMGLDPLTAEGGPVAAERDAEGAWMEFAVAKGLEGFNWAVESSAELGAGAVWEEVPAAEREVMAEEAGRIHYRIRINPEGGAAEFFRIRADE